MANIRHYGLDAILSSGMEGSTKVNGVVGLVSRGYLLKKGSNLKSSIKEKKSPTRTIIELSHEFKNKQLNKNNQELQQILGMVKWKALRKECNYFDTLLENRHTIPRFKRTREKVYFNLSYQVWDKIRGKKGYFNLNELIDSNGFHRSKTIRIVRKWNQLGIVDIIDKSKENNNLTTYSIRLNLKTKSLPHIFYMYTRTEYLTKKTTKRWSK
jgi:hypothetical protein